MKFKCLILIILFMLPCLVSANSIGLYIDGREIVCDVAPIIQNDRTLVPVRAIFEAFGADCSWNEAKQSVSISGSKKIILYIGSKTAYVNNAKTTLDCAPIIQNDRTLVPVRFISETLNYNVDWDGVNKNVYITKRMTNKLLSKNISYSDSAMTMKLSFSSPLSGYTDYAMSSPERIVIELNGCKADNVNTVEIGKNGIERLRMGNHDSYLKLVFDTASRLNYKFNLSADKKSAGIIIYYGAIHDVTPMPDEQREFSVVIDAGHGGTDVGTLMKDENGTPYLYEKDINLEMANYCIAELRARGIKVYATRETDKTLQLSDRTNLANSKNADLFVSVHVNYFSNPEASGTLTLYSKTKDGQYPDKISSKEVAGIIQNKLYQAFGTSNAGIRSEDELYVLRHSTMPAVLIETGFISNDFDRSVLTDSAKLKQGAAAVADAIEEIIKISKEG